MAGGRTDTMLLYRIRCSEGTNLHGEAKLSAFGRQYQQKNWQSGAIVSQAESPT